MMEEINGSMCSKKFQKSQKVHKGNKEFIIDLLIIGVKTLVNKIITELKWIRGSADFG